MNQTYENYYREYFSGKGKTARLKAQKAWRAKLRLKYPQAKSNKEAEELNKLERASK